MKNKLGKTYGLIALFSLIIILYKSNSWIITIPAIIFFALGYRFIKIVKRKWNQKQQRKLYVEKCERQKKIQKRLCQENRERVRLEQENRERVRLEQENRERVRLEQENRDKETNQEEERKQELFEQEQNRIKSRLEQFSLSESEAEILFGKTWKKRMAKPEKEFAYEEISRICVKLEEDCAKILVKIYDFADKVFDMIDYYIQWLGKRKGWDDIDFENWKEDWDDVRETWGREKYQYRPKDSKKQRKKKESSTHFDYCCDVLGIPRDCSKKEIKTR